MIEFPNLNSIEEYFREVVEAAGPYGDFIEAKETWWEYTSLIEDELANEAIEKNLPEEAYQLTNSWD